jgi:hypothetical protein
MKGQVAIFAVIGLMMIIIVGFLFMLSGGMEMEVQAQKGSAGQYIQGCLDQGVEEGLLLLGKNGGFASDAKAEMHPYGSVNYGYYNDNILPDIKEGIDWLNDYTESFIIACLKSSGLSTLRLEGDIEVDSIITEKSVLVKAQIPCAVEEHDSKTRLEWFETTLPVRYRDAFRHANNIASSLDGAGIYDTCLAGSGGLNTYILPYADHDVIVITDPGPKLGGKEFRFIYSAAKKP